MTIKSDDQMPFQVSENFWFQVKKIILKMRKKRARSSAFYQLFIILSSFYIQVVHLFLNL